MDDLVLNREMNSTRRCLLHRSIADEAVEALRLNRPLIGTYGGRTPELIWLDVNRSARRGRGG